MPNAMEYIMASDPLKASGSPFSLQALQQGIRVSFPRRTGVPDNFETIESAIELNGIWNPVSRTAVTRAANGAGQPQTVTVTLPAGEEKRFVRLKAVSF